MRKYYSLIIKIIKVINRSKREYRGRDLKDHFFLISSSIEIIGRIINNASIGSEANSNIAPTTAI